MDVPVPTIGVGLLGTLPPVLFAVSGFLAPHVARSTGLDGGIVLALLLITAGRALNPTGRGPGGPAAGALPTAGAHPWDDTRTRLAGSAACAVGTACG